MKRRARAFFSLASEERDVLLEAWCLLLLADLALRWLPWRRVEGLLAPAQGSSRLTLLSPARLATLVEIAARHHLVPMTCLRRALVLRRLLSRTGSSGALRLGVRREANELLAHAWVEVGERPLGDDPQVALRFAPLLPAHSA